MANLSMRDAVSRAESLGFRVERVRRTGELRFQHPELGLRLTVNGRRKDSSRALAGLLKRAAERRLRGGATVKLRALALMFCVVAGTGARAWWFGRGLLTPCGPRVEQRCPYPGCPCPQSSHTHVHGVGPGGRP